MRCLSGIIKSKKVYMGETVAVEPDLPRIIKKAAPQETNISKNINLELDNVVEVQQEKVLLTPEELVNQEEREKILAQCMEEARKKSELFFENEMQKAYEEGMTKAAKDAESIIEEANIRANEIVADVAMLKNNLLEQYKKEILELEPELVGLSLDIAQKILNKEISNNDDYILNIVKDAMDKVSTKKNVILKVSEKDYITVTENKDIMLAKVEGFADVTVIKEPSLDEGSCIVETEYGIIDGGINTRVEQIKKEIEKMLNR